MNIMRQTHLCRRVINKKPNGLCLRLQRHVERVKKIVYENISECKNLRNVHKKDKECLDDNSQ